MALLQLILRKSPDLLFIFVTLAMHGALYIYVRRKWMLAGRKAVLLQVLFGVSGAFAAACILTGTSSVARRMAASDAASWIRAVGEIYALLLDAVGVLLFLRAGLEKQFYPARRGFIRVLTGAAVAAPAVIVARGMAVGRRDFALQEVSMPVRNLHPDLNGLRILHLSDTHFSPFLTAADMKRVVAIANKTRPHLAVFTGDFITDAHDSLEECIRLLGKLKADAPILCCNGNHEIHANCEAEAKIIGSRYGLDVLRQESRILPFGKAKLNVAGVDYQAFKLPYLTDAEQLLRKDSLNLLLSHNPDVFPVAAKKGFDLTLAGHTHGGQVTVEILKQYANVARFFTPYVSGMYTRGHASLYVTRGIGTVGIPARIGAPPEITLIRLCASSS
jgi:predicted MPP superfamily phosphohydrolase